MAEDVQERFDAGDFGGEVFATESCGEVEVVFGWCVSDENVCFGRHGFVPSVLRASVSERESRVRERRLRASVDVQAAVVGGEVD